MSADPPLSIWFCPTCSTGMSRADFNAGRCIASPTNPDCLIVRSHDMARALMPPVPWRNLVLSGICAGIAAGGFVRLLFWYWPLP